MVVPCAEQQCYRARAQVQLNQGAKQLEGVRGVQGAPSMWDTKSCSFSSSMTDLLTRLRP